ncbi:MAG: lysylphosphatidylglycerol synthase transmembrane domain-containing protein [Bacteroidales bacterium]
MLAFFSKLTRKLKLKGWMKSFIKTFIKVAVTLTLLYWVFSKIETKQVFELYKKANLWLILPAITLFFASQIIASSRLFHFFEVIKLNIGKRNNFRLYLLGMFYNLFLPGGIGGDGYKVFVLSKRFKIKHRKIFWALFNDRLSGLVAVGILTVLLFIVVPIHIKHKYLTLILIAIAPVGYFIFNRLFFREFLAVWQKVLYKSLAIQSLQVLCATFILFSIGIRDNIQGYLMLFLVSSLVSVIPFTVGGIGAREMAFVIGANLIGSKPEVCVALSLIFYLISAIVSLLGAMYIVKPIKFNIEEDELSENLTIQTELIPNGNSPAND